MGDRGPAPTPTALRVLNGETRPSRVNRNEVKPRPFLPEPPLWLLGDAREVWERTVNELVFMRVLTAADGDVLAVYCQAVAHHAEAVRIVNAEGMLVRGREGNWIKNPALQIVRDQAVLVKTLAQQFGLTPAARVGLTGEEDPDAGGAGRILS